jgi:hypothetical protein
VWLTVLFHGMEKEYLDSSFSEGQHRAWENGREEEEVEEVEGQQTGLPCAASFSSSVPTNGEEFIAYVRYGVHLTLSLVAHSCNLTFTFMTIVWLTGTDKCLLKYQTR